jgi:hypothetical protein
MQAKDVLLGGLGFMALSAVFSLAKPTVAGPTQGPTNVEVVNPATAPVPVGGTVTVGGTAATRNIDNPDRTGLVFNAGFGLAAGQQSGQEPFYTVPAGQRFVVENISAQVATDKGILPQVAVMALDSTGDAVMALMVPCVFQGAYATFDNYTCAQTTRGYVDAGTPMVVWTSYSAIPTTAASSTFFVTGHLVSMP